MFILTNIDVVKNAQLGTVRVTNIEPTSFGWTRTREPGPVLGNLDLNKSLVEELRPVLGNPILVYVLKLTRIWLNIGDSYGM